MMSKTAGFSWSGNWKPCKKQKKPDLYINLQEGIMKTFLIIFIIWLLLFMFCWALVHGAKKQRERLGLFEDEY